MQNRSSASFLVQRQCNSRSAIQGPCLNRRSGPRGELDDGLLSAATRPVPGACSFFQSESSLEWEEEEVWLNRSPRSLPWRATSCSSSASLHAPLLALFDAPAHRPPTVR